MTEDTVIYKYKPEDFDRETVESTKNGGYFKHRLVNKKTGDVSPWASYHACAYLDGYVSVSDYYSDKFILTSEEFCMFHTLN